MRIPVFSTIIVILMIINGYEGYRILGMFPLPARSHFSMSQALMKGLARKGHQVDVISPFPLKKPYPNYTDLIQLPLGSPRVNNITYDALKAISKDVIYYIAVPAGNKVCEKLEHPEVLKFIRNPPNDPPYDLVIAEFFTDCFLPMGHHLGVPTIGLSTLPLYPWLNSAIANPHNIAFVSHNLLDYTPPMNFWRRLHNTFRTIYDELYFYHLTSVQDDIVKRVFGPDAPTVREAGKDVALVLMNTHVSIHGGRSMTSAMVEVGGIHVEDTDAVLSEDLKEWMDNSTDGFIYFTFGSLITIESFPLELIQIFFKSLAKIAPTRVLMRVPKPEYLPPGLPENIRTFNWAPQFKVLQHENIKAFITHGGLMGTLEAIHCAVPMIGLPQIGDQFNNVDLYARRKIAIKLDHRTLTEKDMDHALNEILYNPIYKNTMNTISARFRDRPMSSMDTATWWVEYIARRGNKVLRSPAVDLAWWQMELLDVYAAFFLIAAFMIFLSIIVGRFLVAAYIKCIDPKVTEPKKTQ